MAGPNTTLGLTIALQTVGEESVNKLSAAVEKLSATTDNAGKKSGQSFSQFPNQIKQLVQDPLGAAEQQVVKLASSFGPAGIAVAGFATGLSAVAAASIAATRSLAQLGIETQNISLKTGLSTKEVGLFTFASKAAGGEIQDLVTSMRVLSIGLTEGGAQGKKASDALRILGVSTRTSSGELRPMGEIFKGIGEGLSRVGSAAEREKLAVELLGRGAAALIPTLISLKSNLDIGKSLGVGLSDAEENKFLGYQKQIAAVDAQWEIAKRHFKEGIAGQIAIDLVGSAAALLNILAGGHPSAPVASGIQNNALRAAQGLPPLTINTESGSRLAGFSEFNAVLGGNALGASFARSESHNQEGIQETLRRLEEKRANLVNVIGQGGADAATQSRNIAEAGSLKREIEGLKESLKVLGRIEANRVAAIEKANALRQSGEKFFQFAGENGASVFITGNEQQAALDAVPRPRSLRRNGEFNPDAPLLNNSDIGTGILAGGVFNLNSKDVDRSFVNGLAPQELDPLHHQNQQIKLDGLRNELDYTARIVELRAGPGGEAETALKVNSLRIKAAEKEFETTNDIVALENTRTKLAYERSLIKEQDDQKERQKYRDITGNVFDAITGGNPAHALPQLIKSGGLGIGRTIAENAAQQYLFPAIQKLIPHSNNPLLKGTPFQADPFSRLAASTDLNTAAVDKLTAAVTGAALSPSGGGGSAGNIGAGGVFSGSGNNPFVFNNQDSSGGILGSAPQLSAGAPDLIMTGKNVSSGFGLNAGTLGKVAGVAAAAGGAFNAIKDIMRGGARNDIAGVGSALGSAASIAAIVPGGQLVALGLGIAAGVSTLVSSFFPDPKKEREIQQQYEVERNKFLAPTVLNQTQDSSGNYVSTDRKGQLRDTSFSANQTVTQPYIWWKGSTPYDVPGSVTSPFSQPAAPNVTINVNAIDTKTGVDFIQSHSAAVGAAVVSNLQNTFGTLHQEIQRVAR